MYEITVHDIKDLCMAWAEEGDPLRLAKYKVAIERIKEIASDEMGGFGGRVTEAARHAEAIFSAEDRRKAVVYYLNTETPSTWRLISVNVSERDFPSIGITKKTYEFVWWKPE